MAGTSVYAVCRCNGRAVLIDDVATVPRIARDRFEHCYNVLNKSLELPTPPQTASTYLPRIASDVDASSAVEQRAAALAETVATVEVMADKTPAGIAAACLYAASRDLSRDRTFTQQSVAPQQGFRLGQFESTGCSFRTSTSLPNSRIERQVLRDRRHPNQLLDALSITREEHFWLSRGDEES